MFQSIVVVEIVKAILRFNTNRKSVSVYSRSDCSRANSKSYSLSRRRRKRVTGRLKKKKKRDATFFQLRPKLPYDIFHQEGATLPVAPDMLLVGWLLTGKRILVSVIRNAKLCFVK